MGSRQLWDLESGLDSAGRPVLLLLLPVVVVQQAEAQGIVLDPIRRDYEESSCVTEQHEGDHSSLVIQDCHILVAGYKGRPGA